MIKLVIFDLDGVLIDSRDVHYEALNSALGYIDPKFKISRQEHLSTYDGLNTTRKLELLHLNKGLEKQYFDTVWKLKQQYTIELFKQYKTDPKLKAIFEWLRTEGYMIAVASNSIRETVKLALLKLHHSNQWTNQSFRQYDTIFESNHERLQTYSKGFYYDLHYADTLE